MACFRHLWAPRHVNPRIQDERKKHMAYDKKQDEEKEIEEKANELRRLLKDPNEMHEILKDTYIPVGRSTANMLDDVLQDTDMFGDSKDEA